MRRIIIVVIIAAAGWFGWRWLFPDDEAQIRALLERIEESVGSGAATEGEVARIARAAGIRSALDPQITVDAGPPFSKITGRDALIGTVARMNSTVRDLDVQFVDVQITLEPDGTTARAYMTAEARYQGAQGERGLEARELDVTFRKLEGDWVVSTVALVRTLAPVIPS